MYCDVMNKKCLRCFLRIVPDVNGNHVPKLGPAIETDLLPRDLELMGMLKSSLSLEDLSPALPS